MPRIGRGLRRVKKGKLLVNETRILRVSTVQPTSLSRQDIASRVAVFRYTGNAAVDCCAMLRLSPRFNATAPLPHGGLPTLHFCIRGTETLNKQSTHASSWVCVPQISHHHPEDSVCARDDRHPEGDGAPQEDERPPPIVGRASANTEINHSTTDI